ncbi:MAG: GNAT family N-acetyltransferase [Cyanobacteria bacterium P01_A01_bin.83]
MANFITPKVLQIDGFTMQPIQKSDLDALAEIWGDPEVTRFLPSRGVPISIEGTEKALVSFLKHWKERSYGIWTIIKNTSLEMVGYCGLRYLNELDEVEVLYGLGKTYWGKGIATQATKASIFYGFDIVNLDRVIGMVLPDNHASKRVLEKAGLNYEKQLHIFNLDVFYYSIVNRLT